MTGEPLRSQYLEAMGLTSWVSRYRLPNAAPTMQCAWIEPEPPPSQPPAQRLQALLGEAPREEVALEKSQERSVASPVVDSSASSPAAPSRHARRARALLDDGDAGNHDKDGNKEGGSKETAEARSSEMGSDASRHAPGVITQAPQTSLRFSLQIAALDGRWLVMLPGRESADAQARRLLANLLQAAHIASGMALDFQAFDWPMMEGMPVEAPLEEAQDGLRAFVEGRRRRGWRPECLLLFGEDDTLSAVLNIQDRQCRLLDIPGWQGPSLQALAQSADAKRGMWPLLNEWRKAWHQAAQGAPNGDDAPS